MRTIFDILSILLGLLWAFHAEVRDIYVNLQPWLAGPANLLGEIGPWPLIAGGVLSVTLLHVWPQSEERAKECQDNQASFRDLARAGH